MGYRLEYLRKLKAMQITLFPKIYKGLSLEQAEAEYNKLIAKGASVRLVKYVGLEIYTTCFYSKEMILGK